MTLLGAEHINTQKTLELSRIDRDDVAEGITADPRRAAPREQHTNSLVSTGCLNRLAPGSPFSLSQTAEAPIPRLSVSPLIWFHPMMDIWPFTLSSQLSALPRNFWRHTARYSTGKKTPGGAGTHTGAHEHTEDTDDETKQNSTGIFLTWGWQEFRKAAIGNFEAIISNRV